MGERETGKRVQRVKLSLTRNSAASASDPTKLSVPQKVIPKKKSVAAKDSAEMAQQLKVKSLSIVLKVARTWHCLSRVHVYR